MTEKNDPNRYLPNEPLDQDKLSIEIPSEQGIHPERIPSGYDPMGEIQLRGQAYRGLAGGRIPWWILISGWFVFGCLAAVIAHAAINSSSLTLWILFVIMAIPLIILGRGTVAKLATSRQRED